MLGVISSVRVVNNMHSGHAVPAVAAGWHDGQMTLENLHLAHASRSGQKPDRRKSDSGNMNGM